MIQVHLFHSLGNMLILIFLVPPQRRLKLRIRRRMCLNWSGEEAEEAEEADEEAATRGDAVEAEETAAGGDEEEEVEASEALLKALPVRSIFI